MIFFIDLDFCALESNPWDREALQAEAQAWVNDYAKVPEVTVEIISSPRGGWPLVRMKTESPESLLGAIIAYDAGNGDVDQYVQYIEKSA